MDFQIENIVHSTTCDHCDQGDGCIFPHYGLAPHSHDLSGGTFIGSTRPKLKTEWPENFTEDPEEPGMGTYTHCLHCGAPNQPEENQT